MNSYEIQLFEALRFANVPEMPELLKENEDVDERKVWSRAIAVVRTFSGEKAIVVVRNSMTEKPFVIKAFSGDGIREFLEIHPYEYIDSSMYPRIRNREEAIMFVTKTYGVPFGAAAALSSAELFKLIDNYAAQHQAEVQRGHDKALDVVEKNREENGGRLARNTEKAVKPKTPKTKK